MAAVDDHDRSQPSRTAGERVSLTGFLQYHRETLAMKCAGLTPEQLREPAVAPSGLSLLGLVRHMVEVERIWFQQVLSGERIAPVFGGTTASGGYAEFDVDGADVEEAFTAWHAACARSREIVDAAVSLDVRGHFGDEVFSLRYILTHMIEEYARHNGHADLLRERLDGTTGE
jgi:uncharacterized damage-inducible protein DinB